MTNAMGGPYKFLSESRASASVAQGPLFFPCKIHRQALYYHTLYLLEYEGFMEQVPNTEILEFAIMREIDAYRFFTALSRRVQDPDIRVVFQILAREELEHKQKLELEIMKTGHVVQKDLEQLDEIDTSDIDELLPDDMTYPELLQLGIRKEDASYRTYVNLLTQVSNEASRELLMGLAEEEIRHKQRFQEEYAKTQHPHKKLSE